MVIWKAQWVIDKEIPFPLYLFVLGVEAFSGLLRKKANSEEFKWHPRCRNLRLDHLIFADDSLIFTKAESKSANGIKDVLYLIIRLLANEKKSVAFFGGYSKNLRKEILDTLNIAEVSCLLNTSAFHCPQEDWIDKHVSLCLINKEYSRE